MSSDQALTIRPGSVLAFSSPCWGDFWINAGTLAWPFQRPDGWRGHSHVGIIGDVPGYGLALWESEAVHDGPCLNCRKRKAGVHAHPILSRITETLTAGGSVWHYPLQGEMLPSQLRALGRWLAAHDGTKYDWLGAFDARATILSFVRWWVVGSSGMEALYCWEIVAAALAAVWTKEAARYVDYSPNSGTRAFVRLGILQPPTRISSDTAVEVVTIV